MTRKQHDKLARRVRRLEDKQRRDMVALRRETLKAIMAMAEPPEPIELLFPADVLRRLTGVPARIDA